VAALTVLDGVPLNWAAQAFGLNNAGTWLITGILLVASVGAMAALEVTRGDARRRAGLAGVLAAAYVALLVLRLQFLTTVGGDSVKAAALQAMLLTGISASLVLLGSAVLARTRSLTLARARTAARRSRQYAAACQAARRRAAEKMQRHLGALRQMLLVRLSLGPAAPAGAGHASWAAALEGAVRSLFPGL
jgi:sugar/nucleoside kinase (ribokinase family)